MIVPTQDMVLIELIKTEENREGIILADIAKKDVVQEGIVVAVGPGKTRSSILVSLGEKVMFPKYAGIEVQDKDKKFVLIAQNDVLAVIG